MASADDQSTEILASLIELAVGARELHVPRRVAVVDVNSIDPATFLREYVQLNRPVVFDNVGPRGHEAAQAWSKTRLIAAVDCCGARDGTGVSNHGGHDGVTTDSVNTNDGTHGGPPLVSIEVTPDGRGDAIKSTPHGPMFVEPWSTEMTLAGFFDRQRDCGDGGGGGGGASQASAGRHSALQSDRRSDADDGDVAPGRQPAVYYLSHQNSNLSEQMPTLFTEINELAFARAAFAAPPDAVNMWLGPAAAVTSLHKDHYENLYLVLRGAKVFTLFPPTELPFLYETTVRSGKYVPREGTADSGSPQFDVVPVPEGEIGATRPWIAVNPDAGVDLNAHPLYRHAQPITVTVHEGQALYLPSLWYHQVAQRGVPDLDGCCLAVNWWYDMQFGPQYTYFKLVERLARLASQRTDGAGVEGSAASVSAPTTVGDIPAS